MAKEKLDFVVKWLKSNQDENGQWDLGVKANDNIYFPLSDSWRKAEIRKYGIINSNYLSYGGEIYENI